MSKVFRIFLDKDAHEFRALRKGDEVVGPDVPAVETVASLRDREGYYKHEVVFLLGQNNVGDLDGRNMFWDPDSSVADNGDTVIKPTDVTGSGRWRSYQDPYTQSETYSKTEADNRFQRSIVLADDVAGLRDTEGDFENQLAITFAHDSAGDHMGLTYWWNPSSTDADDGETVVKPTDIAGADPGRWISVGNSFKVLLPDDSKLQLIPDTP